MARPIVGKKHSGHCLPEVGVVGGGVMIDEHQDVRNRTMWIHGIKLGSSLLDVPSDSVKDRVIA
jgi:hypothetical protein